MTRSEITKGEKNFVRHLGLSRRTLPGVFRSVFGQQPAQVWIVARIRITFPTDLVNRLVNAPEAEVLLQFHDQRYLVTLPAAR